MTYLNPDNTAACDCDFCVIRRVMLQVMATIEVLPEIGSRHFDDTVLNVYNAAQTATEYFDIHEMDEVS